MDFRDRAACNDEDRELFFPIGPGIAAKKQGAEAKLVCGRCPVAAECLDFAIRMGIDHGVFGGMTGDERRQARRDSLVAAS